MTGKKLETRLESMMTKYGMPDLGRNLKRG
jgi:hypothetical protein